MALELLTSWPKDVTGTEMIAVIFKAKIRHGMEEEYSRIASAIEPILKEIDGFISIERFYGKDEDRRVVSISYWESEEAVLKWREHDKLRLASTMGGSEIFESHSSEVLERRF